MTADVPGSPSGFLESVVQDNAGTVVATGYAFDQSHLYDTVQVDLYADGANVATVPAAGPRPELAYYGVPGNHGYVVAMNPAKTGTVTYCATARNIGPGADKSLGCKAINVVAPGSPIGAIESASSSKGIATVAGWAWDMSAPYDALNVMVTVNGDVKAFSLANQPKPVLAYYGIPGSHGYSVGVPANAGSTVCVFAFNVGPGENRLLDCRKV